MTLALPNRMIYAQGSRRGVYSHTTLEDVRDRLRKMEEYRAPLDDLRPLRLTHVGFETGRMILRYIGPQGVGSEELLFTETAMRHMASCVLPKGFFGGVRELVQMGESGAKVATLAWAKFASSQTRPQLIRTAMASTPTGPKRIVRAVLGQNYATYSNLAFVEDLLSSADGFRDLPVVHTCLTDDNMRLRFALQAPEGLHKPVPMLDAWNSETGSGATKLHTGLWRLVCTNGMGSWDSNSEYRWVHRGSAGRVGRGVRGAVQNLITEANGMVTAYESALDTAIEDAFEWLTQELTGQVPQRVIAAASAALDDPTTTPGRNLASVVDAVALIAQNDADLIEQDALERLSGLLLRDGLRQAKDGVIRLAAK